MQPTPTYNFHVTSGTTSSGNSTFTTLPGTGNAPVVPYVAFCGATSNGVNISWSTNVPATTQLNYGTSAALRTLTPVQTTLTTTPICTSSYVPSGPVYYQLVITDANGNQAVSAEMTFVEP